MNEDFPGLRSVLGGQRFEAMCKAYLVDCPSRSLAMLKRCNFFAVFVGIESPDTETLIAMRKKQNTRRSIGESVHKIYHAGMFVTAGFIVGFDSERVGRRTDDRIDRESCDPDRHGGLLYALPNTQLTRRLAREGRLHVDHDSAGRKGRSMHRGRELRD